VADTLHPVGVARVGIFWFTLILDTGAPR
jgi:hypothetical protein